MGSTLSWHWPLNSTNSAASNFQPLESMPEIPSNNSSNSISGSTKPLLGETLSMPLLPNYHFSVETNTVVMENTGGGNENTPLQGNLLRGIAGLGYCQPFRCNLICGLGLLERPGQQFQ